MNNCMTNILKTETKWKYTSKNNNNRVGKKWDSPTIIQKFSHKNPHSGATAEEFHKTPKKHRISKL